MTKFTIHDETTAPEGSKALVAANRKSWGFLPKLQATMAESPVTLEAYGTLFALVTKSTLSPIEQQIAYQTVNVIHECEYCTAGHTYLSRNAGVPEDVITALRNDTPIADARHEALRRFTAAVVHQRGFAGDDAVDAFIAAGFTKANVLEVVTIIATKTTSNYTNHLTHTPLEDFMADPALRWVAPRNRARVA